MKKHKKQRKTVSRKDEMPAYMAEFYDQFGGGSGIEHQTMRQKMDRLEVLKKFPEENFQEIMSGGASVFTIFKDEKHSLHFIRAEETVWDRDLQMERKDQFLKLPGGKTQGSQLTDELFEQSLRAMACGTGGKDKGFGYTERAFEAFLRKIKWHRASENQMSLMNALKRTAIYEHLEETGLLVAKLEFCSVIYKPKQGEPGKKYPNVAFKVVEVYSQSPLGDLSEVTVLKPRLEASKFSRSTVAMCVPRFASNASIHLTSPAHLLALESCLGEKIV